MDRCLGLAVAHTLLAVKPAFFAKRDFAPRACLLDERLVVPAVVGKLFWWTLLLLSCLSILVPSPLLFLGMFLASSALLVVDTFIISPHLLHFNVASFAFAVGCPSYLHIFCTCLYFYGGLQKVNERFARSFIASFLGASLEKRLGLAEDDLPEWPALGYCAAVSEMIFPVVCLVFRPAHVYGVALHAAILFFLTYEVQGKFGGIIGWNGFCLAYNLTWLISPWEPVQCGSTVLMVVEGVLFGVLPLWSERLGFKMHSQNNAKFLFCVERQRARKCLPLDYLGYLDEDHALYDSHYEFAFYRYALEEAYLMPPLSSRTAATLARHWSRGFGLETVVYALHYDRRLPEKIFIARAPQ